MGESKEVTDLAISNTCEMYDVAESYFKKVFKTLVDRMQDPRKEKLLMAAYKNMGCIYEKKNETEKSLSFYVKALKAGLRVYSPDHLEMADLHYQICCGLLDQDKQFEAMQRLEKVIYMMNRQHESLKEESDLYLPRVGSYYSLLGQFYYKKEQFENANK
jgi:tetratricopeptide (TPR) repeat protein